MIFSSIINSLSQKNMQSRHFIALAALCMLLAVAAGAFGAHALRAVFSADLLAVWQTAVLYQMVHGLGLLAIGILSLHTQHGQQWQLRWAGVAMLLGIVLFSGSLYLLALTGLRSLGAITPLGGVAFLFGWAGFAWGAWKSSVEQ